jgi:hypothetical protein
MDERHQIFNDNMVSYSHFDSNPYNLLLNENLCFRIEENIVESRIAIPQVISLLAFNKEISRKGLSKILDTQFMPLNHANRAISKIPHSK